MAEGIWRNNDINNHENLGNIKSNIKRIGKNEI
jgi:hypothetical protein